MQAAGGEDFCAAVVFGLAGGLDGVQRQVSLNGGDESWGGFLHEGLAVVGRAEPVTEAASMSAGYAASADPAG